jgi:hypothetical protein
MSNFLLNDRGELRVILMNTSDKLGVSEAIVEKDYWVSFVLGHLFHQNTRKEVFTFKGGTSLSKCFNLIDRFSEDIDLILDWRVLGYEENEPWIERSNTQQDRFNKEINKKTEKFLKNVFLPEIDADFKRILGSEINLFIEDENPQSILFEYPKIFQSAYLTQSITMEIGTLATWEPAIKAEIRPMIAEVYPNFYKEKIEARTVAPKRTFWEKATILHHEAHRPKSSSMPPRYARHYYDLYKMASSPVKETALYDRELMKKVSEFKIKFYPRRWAKYEDVISGNIRLVPDEYRFIEIQKDYEAMKEMIYGDYPEFDELMKGIARLEKDIKEWT